MDTSECDLCGARVSPKDLEKGRAIILLKKVWCQKCQVRMLEADKKRRAEAERHKEKKGPLTTTVQGPPVSPRA